MLLLPSQTARVTHSRHLYTESVDDVGGGVYANPKCSTHFDPKLATSPSWEISGHLSDHAGPEDVKTYVGKPPSTMHLATADLSTGSLVSKIDESQTRDHLPAPPPVQSTDDPLPSVHLDSKDVAVGSPSRQRTKFLRLFLQRASCLQSVNHFLSPCIHEKLDGCHEASGISHPLDVVSHVDARASASTSSSPQALEWNNKSRLACPNPPNGYVNWSHLARGEHHNSCTRRAVVPSLRRKSRYRSIQCWANENQQEESNRAQTASETEYDRLNSDVGSNVDSSSSPDEVEPPPSSSTKQPTVLWKTGSTRRQATRNVAFEIDGSVTQRIMAVAPRPSKQPSHLTPRPKRHRSDRPLKRDFSRNSDCVNDCHAPAKEPWINSNLTSESDVPPDPMPQANVSLSNAETGFMPIALRESKVPPVGPSLKDEIPNNSTSKVPPEQLINHVPLRDPIAKNWSSRSSALTDTVRCYVWEGENVSKFDLTMLDIGCNVIRAVERQGISTDYIILACIATVCLPMLSVAFHFNALQPQQTVVNRTELIDATVSATPALLVSRLSAGSSGTAFWPTAPILCDSLLGMQLRMVYQLMTQVSTIFGQPLRWLAALLPVDEASVEHEVAWETFWTLITGRWFICWLRAPDLQGRFVVILGIILRFNIYAVIFFLLCIAERTFQQRLLYAKYFFSLTSARRARKYHVPQFRLNKLRHIKCWLTLRSYLKKRGPQRSVEAIIAAAFYIVFVFGLGLCSQLLSRKDTSVFSHLTNWDILGLVLAIMVFLHRFIILGTKITNKYRNFSVLITEQINLYLSIEKKPHKKDELMSTLQVLRLVESLLKEVDGPFRVCGWTVNPLVYNVFKLVLLSCFSSLLSETLGFKLKLYKLKLNAANW